MAEPKHRVYVAQPTYGGDAKVESVLRASCQATRESRSDYYTFGTSLLGLTFNVLWTRAVENHLKAKRGLKLKTPQADGSFKEEDPIPWDRWVMCHSDIVPEMWWVDPLNNVLDEGIFQVAGVASPIKDSNGLTSVAAGDPHDDWSVRRLTMRELDKLPDVFTSDDIGAPLLINTGLLMVNLGGWCKGVTFTINDRIEWDENDTPKVRVQPEDWNFSRFLYNNAIPYCCVKSVHLDHLGGFRYSNSGTWGAMDVDQYADPNLKCSLTPIPVRRPSVI
jgi:hypothetical protein